MEIAPRVELDDPTKAILLKGRILDRNCQPIPATTVDVWYAGGENRT